MRVASVGSLAQHHACRAVCLLPILFVGACFSPVPSYQGSDLAVSSTALHQIVIEPIAERQGQLLRSLLEERILAAKKTLRQTHTLSVTLTTSKSTRDFGRTRVVGDTRVTARFVLREKRTKEKRILLEGSVTERSNYTVRSKFLARRDAEEEALRHVLALVADEMLLRLRLYFFTQAEKKRENKKDSTSP